MAQHALHVAVAPAQAMLALLHELCMGPLLSLSPTQAICLDGCKRAQPTHVDAGRMRLWEPCLWL